MTIDMKKQYRTRDGREVRIYAVDGGGVWSVHGAVNFGTWDACSWQADGRSYGYKDTPLDLIEVRPRIKREVWVNVYDDGGIATATSRQGLEIFVTGGLQARGSFILDVEEGEGLDNG